MSLHRSKSGGSEYEYEYEYEEDEEGEGEEVEEGEDSEEAFGEATMFADDNEPESKTEKQKQEWQCLSTNDLLKQQDEAIKKVQDILAISTPFARILCIFFRWDTQKLLDIFFEKGKETIYKQAGVQLDNLSESSNQTESPEFECSLCLDDVERQDTTALACGHRFCNSCWSQYISMKVREGQAKDIRCLGKSERTKCNIIFDESKIGPFLNEEMSKKYAKQQLESFVEDNPRVKWCPSVPHCGNCIQVPIALTTEVTCNCNLTFCFKCSHIAHSPTSCEMAKLWEQKCQDDSETANYIQANTKTCPTCQNVVERNGGCNLMTCRCGSFFCWLCGAKTGSAHTWEKIEGHECGRFKEEENQKENAQDSLKRYIFYWERYKAHVDSQKLEEKLMEKIGREIWTFAEKIMPTFELEMSWIENSLLKLFECRRILSWSYVFSFYMFGDKKFYQDMTAEERKIKKNLFEDYQSQLEINIERLSKFLETPTKELVTNFYRDKIKDYTQIVEKRCSGLFDIIEREILAKHPNVQIASYFPRETKKAALTKKKLDLSQDNNSAQSGINKENLNGTPKKKIKFDDETQE